MIVAIDGPAGSGKSTVAQMVARELGFAYLDTGAMYRAVAWRALEEGLDLTDSLPQKTVKCIRAIAQLEPIRFGFAEGEPLPSQVFINNKEVTRQIRTPECDKAVSPVSADPGVRKALTLQQQAFGAENDTVMEGRDIGTAVFPHAACKVFLTASPQERARRRALQNAKKEGRQKATEQEIEMVHADIVRRDAYDSSREAAPLVAATDSWELDTTELSIDEVVAAIVKVAREIQKKG